MLKGLTKYLVAAGLVGVAAVHLCAGDLSGAWHTIVAAGIAAGIPDPTSASSPPTSPPAVPLP